MSNYESFPQLSWFIGVLFVGTTVILSVLMSGDVISASLPARLGRRFQGSRLMRMLQLRGIDPAAYLRVTSSDNLRQHLTRCRDCSAHAQCDAAAGAHAAGRFDFCANVGMIDRLAGGRLNARREPGIHQPPYGRTLQS
ncbi:TPA: DUF6455 family protein [Klebsiella pneumoniae]